MGGTVPRLMGLEYIKRLVEHDPEKSNKQHSSMVFSSILALVYLSDKCLPLKLLWVIVLS